MDFRKDALLYDLLLEFCEFDDAGRCIHTLSVTERGVHAASTWEGQERIGDSGAPTLRTPKRAEARAPNGTDNLWKHWMQHCGNFFGS